MYDRFMFLGVPATDSMRYVRLRIYPERSIHPLYSYVDDADDVESCRVLQWNASDPEEMVLVYEVEGGREGFEATAEAATVVVDYVVVVSSGSRYQAVVHTRASEPMASLWRAATLEGILLVPPLVQLDDGGIETRVVGGNDDIQRMLRQLPERVDFQVDRVKGSGGWRLNPSVEASVEVPSRQKEALEKAYDLGYYSVPREATHDDVADELGCSKSTASEHLRKAEARIVASAMEDCLRS